MINIIITYFIDIHSQFHYCQIFIISLLYQILLIDNINLNNIKADIHYTNNYVSISISQFHPIEITPHFVNRTPLDKTPNPSLIDQLSKNQWAESGYPQRVY